MDKRRLNEEQIFSKDFSNQKLNDTYIECCFEKCNFLQSDFSNAKFVSCTFDSCNLSLTKFASTHLQEVLFKACKLVGCDFSAVSSLLFSIALSDCKAESCNFSFLAMQKSTITNCRLKECTFIETKLDNADFSNTDLTQTLFHHTSLEKADLRSSTNYTIDPQTNALKGAKFSYPEAMSLLDSFDIILEGS